MSDTQGFGLFETNHDLWGSDEVSQDNDDGINSNNKYRFLLDQNGDKITVGTSSLQGAHYGTVLILDRIFQKIVALIESMQRLTATQADRLNFLTDWQRAYTDLGNQVPVFTQGKGAFGSNDDENGGNPYRDDANRVASTYTEQIRNRRTLVENDSRSLQSDVNNNNDAVEQQSNTATSILQQFSTIMSAIFK